MRARVARGLVRWAGRWWDASYAAWCEVDSGNLPGWWEKSWSAGARTATSIAIPIARRLDREATGEQMAQEGWWG